jgi:hypothetical protein
MIQGPITTRQVAEKPGMRTKPEGDEGAELVHVHGTESHTQNA